MLNKLNAIIGSACFVAGVLLWGAVSWLMQHL
jgi:hypothetical protein